MSNETEKGAKWWVRYVMVPILVACISGGGIYTVIKLIPSQNEETTIRLTTPEAPPSQEPVQFSDVRYYAFNENDVYAYPDKKDIELQLKCEDINFSTGQVKLLIYYGQTRKRISFDGLGDNIYSFQYNNKEYQIRYLEVREEESWVRFSVGWKPIKG